MTGCLAGDICLLLAIVGVWKLCMEIVIGIKAEQTKSYCQKKFDEITEKLISR